MMQRFIMRLSWPPEGRSRFGHAYVYLVLADNPGHAMDKVAEYWEGKQGWANPHTLTMLGVVEADLFELHSLPQELR